MKRICYLAILGLTLALAIASAQYIEERQYRLQRRIAEDISHNLLSPRDASHLEHDLDKVSRHIAGDRSDHRGHLTPRERDHLNRELDRIEQHLRESERHYGYNRRRY